MVFIPCCLSKLFPSGFSKLCNISVLTGGWRPLIFFTQLCHWPGLRMRKELNAFADFTRTFSLPTDISLHVLPNYHPKNLPLNSSSKPSPRPKPLCCRMHCCRVNKVQTYARAHTHTDHNIKKVKIWECLPKKNSQLKNLQPSPLKTLRLILYAKSASISSQLIY